MLGFGFNKAKVLASAERNVQQGKLQNAIAEYEKIIKEDPKDITVLNTIGDLNARLGNVDQALSYFRKVGDHYAAEGFTVKAIAMYKKLTKLNPSALDCIQKLAELYTQQGLYNDARQQFMLVADNHVRNGNTDEATKIFQKMLELDPDNLSLQTKLAELYVRTGKKDEAKNIYLRAAENLFQKGSVEAAGEWLNRVISVEPTNTRALHLRAQIALDSGDAAAALSFFERIPDLDSRPDALKAMLQATIKLGKIEEAAPTAKKLLTVHHDISGIRTYADLLLSSGKVHEAIGVFQEYSDQLVAADGPGVVNALNSYVSRVKDDPGSLEALNTLFLKAGDTSHSAEIMELLAHACVQKGELERARDLYKELSVMEPENPLHGQNYRQILAKLGEDSAVRTLSAEEGSQALMVEELESLQVVVEQHYPDFVASNIQSALTESDLFESYNVPQKAIAPLEGVLPQAPQDVRVNQRLAALYARLGRTGDAAIRCAVLQQVFSSSGHPEEALKYGEMASKYAAAAGIALPEPETLSPQQISPAEPKTEPAFSIEPEAAKGTVGEFNVDSVQSQEQTAEPAPTPHTVSFEDFSHVSIDRPSAAETSPVAEVPAGQAHEFDLSEEWESIVEVEAPAEKESAPAAFEAIAQPVYEAPEPTAVPEPASFEEPARDPAKETVEEIEFYLAQSMWNEAASALQKLSALAPEDPSVEIFRARIAAATISAPQIEVPEVEVEPLPEETEVAPAEEPVAEFVPAPEPEPVAEEAPQQPVIEVTAVPPQEPDVVEQTLAVPEPEKVVVEPERFETPIAEPAPEQPLQLEPAEAVPVYEEAVPSGDVLDDFVADLDASLGEDFVLGGKPAPPAPSFSTPAPAPPPPVPAVAACAEPVPSTPSSAPQVAAMAAAATAPAPVAEFNPASLADDEGTTLLNDLFQEFKEDVEEGGSHDEDPETHYNLGVAFREMGLLDEAIGELQKVSQCVERGQDFSQKMQAYTWLASCFLEKGVPEASFKWFQKALQAATDDDTRTAIHYELACAYETANMKPEALQHFMEVYTTNIDFRDVAERIKALKS